MGRIKGQNEVFCISADSGKKIWEYPFESIGEPQSTSCIDGELLYAISSGGELFCLTAKNGRLRWRKDLIDDFHAERPHYFFAVSPVTYENLLLLNINEYGTALNKNTGETVWTSPPTGDTYISQYTTPIFFPLDGKQCALIFGNYIIYAVDLNTGKPSWGAAWEQLY
jgi:outer membrane protein assembly factor BamB